MVNCLRSAWGGERPPLADLEALAQRCWKTADRMGFGGLNPRDALGIALTVETILEVLRQAEDVPTERPGPFNIRNSLNYWRNTPIGRPVLVWYGRANRNGFFDGLHRSQRSAYVLLDSGRRVRVRLWRLHPVQEPNHEKSTGSKLP